MNPLAAAGPWLPTAPLLAASNACMTFARHGRLKTPGDRARWVAPPASRGIAPFEHLLQVPASRIGHAAGISLGQLKIAQEALTLAVFVPRSILCMRQPPRLDGLWAGLCLVGAAYFVFRAG